MNRHWLLILLFLFATSFVRAQQDSKIAPADSLPVYQGVGVKLDVAMPIIEVARSVGKIQTYELAVNVRLLNRFYPILETGYAIAQCGADGGDHKGHGGFARVGMDMAVIKKGVAENNVLVGLRFGNAFQRYDLTNVQVQTDYWPSNPLDFYNQFRYDCWGEIVAGCQVFVWKGLHLGWTGRMKFLMTRNAKPDKVMPYYVPGLGFRKDFNWGFNYYIGYRF